MATLRFPPNYFNPTLPMYRIRPHFTKLTHFSSSKFRPISGFSKSCSTIAPFSELTHFSSSKFKSICGFSKFCYITPSSFAIAHVSSSKLRGFCGFAKSGAEAPVQELGEADSCRARRTVKKTRVSEAELRENWLSSLTCPLEPVSEIPDDGYEWVMGIDPDLSGAIALLKTDGSGCSAQVFDTPYLEVLVGKGARKRLDVRSTILLLRSFGAPLGTTAYVEQSIPFPKDGKQGWWSGGFGYGLWIGILVTSGFSVVPIPSLLWKNHFELTGGTSTKDDSRNRACELFPSLSSSLKRKKDHVNLTVFNTQGERRLSLLHHMAKE
ncbi:uncharacterized protein LOC18427156 isoform X2 [Amborella trichopoda]|uniref:uncharacterized protein LOC18427156 isoform X2 n=1 Tax=Amborella trichopoda TaxID=13333 RepID=UPI0009BE74AF|nr:uncharacterized protein LOC18427156 isoform X2 [Amborella trichopoda]|eukprot:XP_020518548.1 uncharacterized protein LOC18427156 isoform X2 [Amborella trichopoda]